ncbi:MAG TPA: VacJ family lipoprotein [Rhodospirillales bacterium]|nr:VacJ family lipoprotein [Rhodospirillales bacterium]
MVSAMQRARLIINLITPALSRLIVPISRVAAAVVVVILFDVRQPFAGPSIYNMDHLLLQPHPFGMQPSINRAVTPPENRSKISKQYEFGSKNEYTLSEVNDPLESVNRRIFAFNEVVRQYLLDPVVTGYYSVLPEVAREAIANALNNISEPVVLANDLLQGKFKRGFVTASRLVINTTAGVGGLFDVAKNLGFEEHEEDFGQTLATWGIGDGLYLVLPLLGPSNPRDAFGQILVDPFFDPLGYYLDDQDLEEVGYGLIAFKGVVSYADVKDHMDGLKDTSVDFYGTIRSLHLQKRKLEILNQD